LTTAIKVWDIATRSFHWSLVVCFFIAYITGDEGNLLHVYSSYIIIGLLAFRLIWGFIGPKYVRFSNFIHGIQPTLSYLRSILIARPSYYLGHNPLGGWMIVMLLVSLTMTSWTGLELYAIEGKGPLATVTIELVETAQANGDDDKHERENEKGEDWLEELHEALAGFTLFLVFVHIGGVLLSSLLHRENFIKAMWTGYKTPPDGFNED